MGFKSDVGKGEERHTLFNQWRSSCSVQSSGSAVVSTVGGGILKSEDARGESDGELGTRHEESVWRGQGQGRPTSYEASILPVGSGCAGNISLPHMDHTAAAVMIPAKAMDCQ